MPIIDCRKKNKGQVLKRHFAVWIWVNCCNLGSSRIQRKQIWSEWRKGWAEVGLGSYRATMTDCKQAVASHIPLTFHQRIGIIFRHSSFALMTAGRVAYPFEVLQQASSLRQRCIAPNKCYYYRQPWIAQRTYCKTTLFFILHLHIYLF